MANKSTKSGRQARFKTLVRTAPDDIRKPEFQKFMTDFFAGKLRAKPPKRPPAPPPNSDGCVQAPLDAPIHKTPFRKRPKLFLHQHVMGTVARILAHNAKNTNRGLLAWHSTGSGKTCTATAIMDAFWDTSRHIVYVSSTEALASNPPENFYRCAMKYMQRFGRRAYKGKTANETLEKIGAAFSKRGVQFTSFAKLAHFLLIHKPLTRVADPEFNRAYLNNAIVIVDEVQNIFKPLAHQRKESEALRKFFLDAQNRYAKDMKMVILTATPGNTAEDLVNLLNMVRDPSRPVIQVPNPEDSASMQAFRDGVRGLVSFFDMSGDLARFPQVLDTDNTQYRLPMLPMQFEAYAEALSNEAPTHKDFNRLMQGNQLQKYYHKARKYSNMLFDRPDGMTVEAFSAKLPKLLEILNQYPNEKHYVYTGFYTKHGYGGQGIHALAKILQEALGYERLKGRHTVEQLTPSKRFVLATSNELSQGSAAVGAAGRGLQQLLEVYNHPENKDGKYVHVFLASQGYNEGVDLKHVRHVHLFDPLLTYAADRQAIGRAARYCSHSGLARESGQWTVKVHRYFSDKPVDLTIYDNGPLKEELGTMAAKVEQAKQQLDALKGVRSPEAKAERERLQGSMKALNASQRSLAKRAKEIERVNALAIEMIDAKIYTEAKQRGEQLRRIYQAVFETAIDCMVFKDFHSTTGYTLRCDMEDRAFPERMQVDRKPRASARSSPPLTRQRQRQAASKDAIRKFLPAPAPSGNAPAVPMAMPNVVPKANAAPKIDALINAAPKANVANAASAANPAPNAAPKVNALANAVPNAAPKTDALINAAPKANVANAASAANPAPNSAPMSNAVAAKTNVAAAVPKVN